MSTLLAPRRFNVREYLRLGETGILAPEERLELIDGQILAMRPQGPAHSAVVAGRCEEHRTEYPRQVVMVVEVSQTSLALDRGRKAQLYAASGVPDYWIVNMADQVVEVHREPSPGGYELIRKLTTSDRLLPLALEPSGAPLAATDFLTR